VLLALYLTVCAVGGVIGVVTKAGAVPGEAATWAHSRGSFSMGTIRWPWVLVRSAADPLLHSVGQP
jgi:hypothetical protein